MLPKSPIRPGESGASGRDAALLPTVPLTWLSLLRTQFRRELHPTRLALGIGWRFGDITPTRILAAWIALAALLGAPGAPPAARADTVDDAFLAALQAKNIHYPMPELAIVAGHAVCNELRLGKTPPQVASEVMDNSELDGYHAGYFVGASMRAYCPRYIS
jgi:hypothetical protein